MYERIKCAQILALFVFFIWTGAAMTQDTDEVVIETIDLGSGIYALYGRGGTIGVSVGDDGVFAIDGQYAQYSDAILNAIEALSDRPIRYVLNTHWHGDHTGGNENFAATGAVILAHENVRTRMMNGMAEDTFGRRIEPAVNDALPDITLTDGATFYFNDLEARVIFVPHAHTDGDSIIVFDTANVIHMGDIFWNGYYPLIDIPSGGSLDGMIQGLELGLALGDDDTMFIAGHGLVGDRPAVVAAHQMLIEVRARIAPLVTEGLSEDEAAAADPLADLNDQWGGWFINGETMTRIVYRSLWAMDE